MITNTNGDSAADPLNRKVAQARQRAAVREQVRQLTSERCGADDGAECRTSTGCVSKLPHKGRQREAEAQVDGRSAAVDSSGEPPAAEVHVMSFSYGRGPFPFSGTDITLDLRGRFNHGSSIREFGDITDVTGLTVCDACAQMELAADGAIELVEGVVPLVAAFRSGTGEGPVTVAMGCADGQLSAAVATAMQRRMNGLVRVTVEHLTPATDAAPQPGTTPAVPQDPPAPPQSAGADPQP